MNTTVTLLCLLGFAAGFVLTSIWAALRRRHEEPELSEPIARDLTRRVLQLEWDSDVKVEHLEEEVKSLRRDLRTVGARLSFYIEELGEQIKNIPEPDTDPIWAIIRDHFERERFMPQAAALCAEVRDLYARFEIVEKQREAILNEGDADWEYQMTESDVWGEMPPSDYLTFPAYEKIKPVNFEFWDLVKSLNEKCDLLNRMLRTSEEVYPDEHRMIRETLATIEELPEMHL